MLERERRNRESHAGHGRGDQEQETKLDQSAAAEAGSLTDDALDTPQVARLTLEDSVVRLFRAVANQVYASAQQDDGRREHDTDTEQAAHRPFDAVVRPRFRSARRQNLPTMPL